MIIVRLNLTTDITYKLIHHQVVKFIHENNNKRHWYLECPKFYLNGNKPKCDNKQHCKQCYNNSTLTHNLVYLNVKSGDISRC